MISLQTLLAWMVTILLALGSLGLYLNVRYAPQAIHAQPINTITCMDSTKSCGYI